MYRVPFQECTDLDVGVLGIGWLARDIRLFLPLIPPVLVQCLVFLELVLLFAAQNRSLVLALLAISCTILYLAHSLHRPALSRPPGPL